MHNHSPRCKHENIQFCPKCQEPYCEDCSKEWKEPCMRNHYDNWNPYYPYYPDYPPFTWDPISAGDPMPSETITICCEYNT